MALRTHLVVIRTRELLRWSNFSERSITGNSFSWERPWNLIRWPNPGLCMTKMSFFITRRRKERLMLLKKSIRDYTKNGGVELWVWLLIWICKRILNYQTRTIDKIAPKDTVAENQSIMIHRFAPRADCQSRARAMALAFFLVFLMIFWRDYCLIVADRGLSD